MQKPSTSTQQRRLRAGAWILSLAGLASVLLPTGAVAQKQSDLQILNRTVYDLQMEVNDYKKANDEKMSSLKALLEQTLDAANKANASLSVLKKDMDEQQKSVAAPIAGVGTKIDALTNEFSFVKTNVEIMNQRLTKLQAQVVELDNTIKTMQAPAPPPPAAGAQGPVNVTPQDLMSSANRDKISRNTGLALQQYADYLRLFPNNPEGCEAQYNIGEIQYTQKKYKDAIDSFDLVFEKYPTTCIQADDARYMKAMALKDSGNAAGARAEFQNLVTMYPDSPLVGGAQDELKKLPAARPPASSRTKKGSAR